MIGSFFKAIILVAFLMTILGCKPKVELQETNTGAEIDGSGAIVGGMNSQGERLMKPPTQADEMLKQQEKEMKRQKKELDDVRRQQYYDQEYRKYESERK